jgi:hypothetical protein
MKETRNIKEETVSKRKEYRVAKVLHSKVNAAWSLEFLIVTN